MSWDIVITGIRLCVPSLECDCYISYAWEISKPDKVSAVRITDYLDATAAHN